MLARLDEVGAAIEARVQDRHLDLRALWWCRQGHREHRRSGGDQDNPRSSCAAGRGCDPRAQTQYVSIRYSKRLAEGGVEPSVGSKGNSYDNALAETINALYKAELIHRRAPWKTTEAVEFATLEWVSWFNNTRLLAPIGHIPPAEAKPNYYRELERSFVEAA